MWSLNRISLCFSFFPSCFCSNIAFPVKFPWPSHCFGLCCFRVFFFLAAWGYLWDVSFPTRDQTKFLAVEAQSPNHWIAREVPDNLILNWNFLPAFLIFAFSFPSHVIIHHVMHWVYSLPPTPARMYIPWEKAVCLLFLLYHKSLQQCLTFNRRRCSINIHWEGRSIV